MTLWAWFIQESIQKFKHGILIKKEFLKKWMLYSYMLLKRGERYWEWRLEKIIPSRTHKLMSC